MYVYNVIILQNTIFLYELRYASPLVFMQLVNIMGAPR